MKIEITKPFGKWLVNGKQYNELVGAEKIFFDEFLIAMRLIKGAENHDNQKQKQC
jgi:hypothetical protein